MATTVTPTTPIDAATVPQSVIDYLTALTDPSQVQNFFDAFKQYSPVATTALSGVNDTMGKINATAKQVGASMQQWGSSSLSGLKDMMGGINQSITHLSDSQKSLAAQTLLVAGAFAGILPASQSFMTIGSGAEIANRQMQEMRSSIDTLQKGLSVLPGGSALAGIVGILGTLQNAAAPAKQFESGMIAIAGASGTLNELLSQVGDNFEGMNRYAEQFSQQVTKIGNSTGLSSTQVADYAHQLMTIPSAMNTTVEGFDRGVNNMHMLDAAIKVATGTGQSFKDVFNDLNSVYLNFGTTGQRALEYVTRMSAAAQQLQLPLSLVKDFTQRASAEFKFFGDNTQATLNILNDFGGALKNTGLGGVAVEELSAKFVTSISRMDVAQQAFISKSSGGVGGLQGAAQIQLLQQQGKTDEVAKKVEQTLRKQFGGRIVTLEQAAQDQGSAAVNFRQAQMLTQGPTKIADTIGEAQKILQAMAKGQVTGLGSGKKPDEAFRDALSVGDKVQQKQYDATVVMTNLLKREGDLAAISAYSLQRIVTGSGTPLKGDYLSQLRRDSQNFAAQTATTAPGQPRAVGKSIGELINETNVKNEANKVKGLTGAVAGDAKQLFNDLFSDSSKKPATARNAVNQTLQNYPERPTTPGQNSQPGKQIIEVQSKGICVRCAKEIANEEATKVSRRHIHQNDMNKDNSVTTGTNPGL